MASDGTRGADRTSTNPGPSAEGVADGPLSVPTRLLEEYLASVDPTRSVTWSLESHAAHRAILAGGEELQLNVFRALLTRLAEEARTPQPGDAFPRLHPHLYLLHQLLNGRLPLNQDDLREMLDVAALCAVQRESNTPDHIWLVADSLTNPAIYMVEEYVKDYGLVDDLRSRLHRLRGLIVVSRDMLLSEARAVWHVNVIDAILEDTLKPPYRTEEPWVRAILHDLSEMEPAVRASWQSLLSHAATASGSKPSGKWLQSARAHVQAVGEEPFASHVAPWLDAAGDRDAPPPTHWNRELLRGLVWSWSALERAAAARSLAFLAEACFEKVAKPYGVHDETKMEMRSERVGNACIYSLGTMSGAERIAQLARLKTRIKHRPAQVAIQKALDAAAEKAGLAPDELEELIVPTYGLDAEGQLREPIGSFTAKITLAGQQIECLWRAADGKPQKSVPAEIGREHATELKALKQTVADIEKMLPAQRDRIETLLRTERSWALPVWCERYLDQPLLAGLTRRLIWYYQQGDRSALGIWHEGRLVDIEDRPLDWLTEETQVRLWHPIGFPPETILQWRRWLEEHGVTQPFKQAHREIYLLTDAELTTRTYSNRFAAHLLKQHQFKALCDQKGWQYRLLVAWDSRYGDDPVARLELPQWNLRAEIWVDPAGGDRDAWTEAGAYLYISTDQVRFCDADGQPRPLTEVPALAVTEVMRDVDLFVGVASVGNDPMWQDSGGNVGWRDYWQS